MKSIQYINEIGVEYWYIPDPALGEPKHNTIGGYAWHREDGPAYIGKWSIEYWFNDKWHRYDGPAYIDLASQQEEYYIHQRLVDTEEYLSWLNDMGMDIDNLTDEDKVLIDLKCRNE